MEFKKIEQFVLKEYSIDLSAYKSKQLLRRVESFMTRAGAKDEDEFILKLKTDSALSKKFLDHLTINVSEFFRNKDLFLELEGKIKEQLHPEKRTLKIWSAACSNGAEPYTLAIILDKLTPNKKHNILATDIDTTILEVAKRGIYKQSDVKNVDNELLNKYFQHKDDNYIIKDFIKERVTFKKHDLILDRYENDFDLIVCRNVVIYFTQEIKNQIYKKFFNAMKPGALLFVGATESIYNYKEFGFEKASTFIYRKPGGV
ncbi:Chemotaxis protein methyltransferase Cher2 [Caloramator mitchellensis]|uniref:Chemotaxis protein methyltransferase Cher2 n=1 Tax=Caloramator mitchellensis TaxID=908809 RepID=A0A0R3JXS1_CALMK|nr:protein-glutamate O-methyltransferase CheR [Caloramator mitchellensis]KRQ85998.1 Chemotaxis protein methyltransferase Cher2 [Caloramator mitchellensis]